MSCNINEYLNELDEKKNDASVLLEMIKVKRQEYDTVIGKLNGELSSKRKEMQELNDTIVSVRLGDLIEEISWLSGVDVNEICVLMNFNIDFSDISEMYRLIDDVRINEGSYCNDYVRFRLWSNKNNDDGFMFDYFTFLTFDLNDVQADGEKLIEHCSIIVKPFTNGELSTEISIDKKIEDIICNFSLKYLKNKDNTSWYPNDLFSMAIINCSQRNYNSKTDKIRERVK